MEWIHRLDWAWKLVLFAVLLGGFESRQNRAWAAVVTWTGGAGTFSWDHPGNWSGNAVPTAADDVVIPDLEGEPSILLPSGLGSDTRVRSIQSSELLSVPGTLRTAEASSVAGLSSGMLVIDGDFAITQRGVIPQSVAGSGRLLVGEDAVVTVNGFLQQDVTCINSGTIEWTGGNINSSRHAFINTGTLRINVAAGSLVWSGNTNASFINEGLIEKFGTGTAQFLGRTPSFVFESSGDLRVTEGTLNLDVVGEFSGSVDVAADGRLGIRPMQTGSLRFTPSSVVQGDGTLSFSQVRLGGSFDVDSTLIAGYDTVIESAGSIHRLEVPGNSSISLLGNVHIEELDSRGLVQVDGPISLGTAVVHSGQFQGNGNIFIRGGLTLLNNPANTLRGTLTFGPGSVSSLKGIVGESNIVNSGTLLFELNSIRIASFVQTASGLLRFRLESSPGVLADSASLDGNIEFVAPPDFAPELVASYTLDVIRANAISGAFTNVTLPTAPTIGSYRYRASSTTISILHDPFDHNGDGAVDADDVIAYIARWDAGNRLADINADGAVDSDDIIYFFRGWDAGGR